MNQELSPKEVAECDDDLPPGYEITVDADYVGILYCGAEIWNNKKGWLCEQKTDNEILNHFKKRREQALLEQEPTDEQLEKAKEVVEKMVEQMPPPRLGPGFPIPKDVWKQISTDPKEQAAEQKAQHYLLPPEFLKQVTAVLEHGADKYGPYNWRKGDCIRQDVYISAALRHLIAIMEGEWLDPDSEKAHWAHIAATAAIMVDVEKHRKLIK